MTTKAKASEEREGPAMFEPVALMPDQFAGALRQKGFVEGEKRLLAAVLADAVECYMKQIRAVDRRSREVFTEAEAWIFDHEASGGFLSFQGICEVLGLEPEYVRRGLISWGRRHQGSPPARDFDESAASDGEEMPPLKAAG